MARIIVVAALLVVGCMPAGASGSNVFGGDEVVVAVIDTGIMATHQEFDYRGPDSEDDQLVGWFDFTAGDERLPRPGQTWDDVVVEPVDPVGHGTAVASLAVGLNRAPADRKDRSFAPGAKLAAARVCRSQSCGPIAPALEWAVETVGADVVNISIASIVPRPEMTTNAQEAIRRARDAGVLVVVANGNGMGNVGGPLPAWTTPSASSTDALSVGAADEWGFTVSTDPEVTAKFLPARMADTECETCYSRSAGTSFSAPLVAGMAAAAMGAARQADMPDDPDRIESVLKYSARDTISIPPTMEGYGELDADQFPLVMQYAVNPGLPARAPVDLAPTYVDEIGTALRDAWSNKLDGDLFSMHALPVDPGTGQGKILGSTITGITEGELYRVELSAGETLSIQLESLHDPLLDYPGVAIYAAEGPSFEAADLLKRGYHHLIYRARRTGTVTAVVGSWLAPAGDSYTIATSTSDPSTPEPVFEAEHLYVTTGPALSR